MTVADSDELVVTGSPVVLEVLVVVEVVEVVVEGAVVVAEVAVVPEVEVESLVASLELPSVPPASSSGTVRSLHPPRSAAKRVTRPAPRWICMGGGLCKRLAIRAGAVAGRWRGRSAAGGSRRDIDVRRGLH